MPYGSHDKKITVPQRLPGVNHDQAFRLRLARDCHSFDMRFHDDGGNDECGSL
jgi:hypothetical protein